VNSDHLQVIIFDKTGLDSTISVLSLFGGRGRIGLLVKTFRVGVDHLGELLGRRVLKLFNFVIAAAQIWPECLAVANI